jgi:WD40 repeat protein
MNSNLAGVVHVASRMDWYCAIIGHLLHTSNTDAMDISIELVVEKLKPKVLELYKAILLYQMRAVHSYYRNQGWNFLLQTWNFDDWDDALADIDKLENSLLNDWGTYDRARAASVRSEQLDLTRKIEDHVADIRQTLKDHFDQQNKRYRDKEVNKLLSDLCVVNPQDDVKRIENEKEELIEDSYKWILEDNNYKAFTNWADSDPPKCRLLWIHGDAGMGKSMLMMGIIRAISARLAVITPSLSYFFFQSQGKTKKTLDKATDALRSLLWMLLTLQPDLVSHLQEDYRISKDTIFKDENSAEAMIRAFSKILKEASPVYFVLDALDECDHDFQRIIEFIATSLCISTKIKWLVSSRPEVGLIPKLQLLLKSKPTISPYLLQLDIEKQERHAEVYIQHKLRALKKPEISSWPDSYDDKMVEKIKKEVTERAQGNLLWVSLVFKDLFAIRGNYAVKRVEKYPVGLPKLYDHKISNLENEEGEDLERCKDVLAIMSCAHRALSDLELSELVPWSDEVDIYSIVTKCSSFVTLSNKTVLMNHTSAKDYLISNRSKIKGGTIQGQEDIVRASIQAMKPILKRNIYELNEYGLKPSPIKTPDPDPLAPIAYSCVFWSSHFSSADSDNPRRLGEQALANQVLEFLKEDFLYWLESLSLLGEVHTSIRSIRMLVRIAQVCCLQFYGNNTSELVLTASRKLDNNRELPVYREMAEFLIDAERFVLSHGSIVQKAPLQLYASALVFTPKNSMIRTQFYEKRLPFIKSAQGSTSQWDRLRQTLEGHKGSVRSLAFSPSDQDSPGSMKLASTSTDGTVRLWDPIMGEEKLKFRSNEHTPSSSSEPETRHYFTAFSPDGKAFASSIGCSVDDIKVFDVASGKVKNTLKLIDASSVVQSGMFSLDHKKFLAISSRLAREENQRQQRHGRITAFNPLLLVHPRGADRAHEDDQQRLHHGLHVRREQQRVELRVWNLDEGTSHRIGSYGKPTALSLDATLLASVEGERDINLWNTDTGDLRHTLEGHETAITNIVFCRHSNCNLLVSFSPPKELRIWDADAGVMKHHFQGHTSNAESTVMAIWPRDNLIAFARPLDISVYDYVNQIQKQTYRNQMTDKYSMLYSPDGMTLAVGVKSREGKHHIELWATDKGPYDETLRSLWPSVSLAFSPDGRMIASDKGTSIVLWDASTATLKHTWLYPGEKRDLSFSRDGVIFATRYTRRDKGLLFCNTVTGDHKNVVEGVEEGNPDFVFSPDGRMLATTWNTGHTVQLWDSRSCHHVKTFELNDMIRELSFSTDGSVLHTDERDFAISPSEFQSESKTETNDGLSEHSIPRAFSFGGEWIVCDTKPQVWIPPQYRGPGKAVFGNRVALESSLKGLVVIELDPEHAC